jgi:hypothetical protein
MHVYSSNTFKRTGQPFYPVLNAHQTQAGPILNQSHPTANQSLLRSLNAVQNGAMQRCRSQTGASTQVATSMNLSVPPSQTQMGIQGDLADLTSKSWQDILVSLASELGVSDYPINTSGVQQPVSTPFPANSGALDGTQTGNMTTHAQSIDSTMEQNTGNLDANGISGNLHDVHDVFEAVASSPLYGFEENWINSPEFS